MWLPSSSGQRASYTWCGMTSTSASAPTRGMMATEVSGSLNKRFNHVQSTFRSIFPFYKYLLRAYLILSLRVASQMLAPCRLAPGYALNAPTAWADSPGNTGHAACFCHTIWSQRHPGPSFCQDCFVPGGQSPQTNHSSSLPAITI